MRRQTKEVNGFKLHLYTTKKYRENTVRITFKNIVKKDEITIGKFLLRYLNMTNSIYKNEVEIEKEILKLYSPNISGTTYIIGKIIKHEVSFNTLHESFTEEGYFKKTTQFVFDLLLKPNFNNEQAFNNVKNSILEEIELEKENKQAYSKERLFELMDEEYLNYKPIGYKDDLLKITLNDLEDFYNKMLKEFQVDVYVIGNIDFDETTKIIEEKFIINNDKNNFDDYFPKLKKIRNEVTKIEEDDIKQSVLTVGLKVKNLTKNERFITSMIFNSILGGPTSSKLFRIIREENSLCYYIYSMNKKVHSSHIIVSGINASNYDKTLSLIKTIVDAIKSGDFTDEEVENYKLNAIDDINLEDSNGYKYLHFIEYTNEHKLKSTNNIKKQLKNVTKEDIIKYANKVEIDSIFFLKGESK